MGSRPAWAEVELNAIAQNFREIRGITQSQARIMAVVKANAYGHGVVPVSKTVIDQGADYLGVAIFDEALELRNAGINVPILILGYNPKEQLEEAVRLGLTQTVYSMEGAREIAAAAQRLQITGKIHIKIDTGMTRLGFIPGSESLNLVKQIASLEGLNVEGIYTHFAVADTADKSFTMHQLRLFLDFCTALEVSGVNIPLRHAANSAAIIDLPESHLDMVRLGIALYGLYPSNEVLKDKVDLKPAMALKAYISNIKEVPANTTVSYGRTYTTSGTTTIATVPLGYADGYSRLLSSRAEVLVKGKRAPVAGIVCMDQLMIDVGHIPGVAVGDEVVLLGTQGQEEVSADELARILGTINYEIVCMLSNRLPRVYR